MAIGLSALIEHANRTNIYQHTGCRMPSLKDAEEFSKKIAYLEKHREEIHEAAKRKLIRELSYIHSLEGTKKHIPLVKLEELYKLAIRNQGTPGIVQMRDYVISRIESYPMPRNRTNYLSVVRWRNQAKKTIWAFRKLAAVNV